MTLRDSEMSGGGPASDFYPEMAVAGMAFDWLLNKAFHMEDDVVDFQQAWHTVPLGMRTGGAGGNFAVYGGDYDYKYWLFYEYPADEEHAFKYVHSVYQYAIEDGTGMTLDYLQKVVWALHSMGPPSLGELAIKRVLELGLSLASDMEDEENDGDEDEDENRLPPGVRKMIAAGPQDRPLTQRGQHLLEVLREKEEKDLVEKKQEEEMENDEDEEVDLGEDGGED